MFRCFYCLSLWIAAPFAWSLDADPKHFVLLWLALSAAAILIERRLPPRAEWWSEPAGSGGIQEDKEEMPDVLLRK